VVVFSLNLFLGGRLGLAEAVIVNVSLLSQHSRNELEISCVALNHE
jgi:hypothetical protein